MLLVKNKRENSLQQFGKILGRQKPEALLFPWNFFGNIPMLHVTIKFNSIFLGYIYIFPHMMDYSLVHCSPSCNHWIPHWIVVMLLRVLKHEFRLDLTWSLLFWGISSDQLYTTIVNGHPLTNSYPLFPFVITKMTPDNTRTAAFSPEIWQPLPKDPPLRNNKYSIEILF